eukprot:TRINITY_DN3067_c0_g1_i1.p3 TRINITY_DN3067_c0_g1~~TRINITY_DN3067_c0_g1_i1.p3  ORF type:complete len:145 (-),score=14.69 TRINITY_DN3067_c0_g1_i1:1117-1551(-)
MDLQSLIRKPLESPEVKRLTQGKIITESKVFKDCKYLNYKDDGLSILLTSEDIVNSIFVYGGKSQGFSTYKGDLPLGLRIEMVNTDVVKLLGEPEGKPKPGGPAAMPIYVDYKSLGIQIDFLSASYEDRANPIGCICFYAPTSA